MAAAAAAAAGADVVADDRRSDDFQGAGRGVVNATGGIAAVAVVGNAQATCAARAGATASAHVCGVVAAAVAADAADAGLPAEGAGARSNRAAMAAALTAQPAAAAAAAIERPGDTTAPAAARRGVGGDRNVVQGQDAGVENTPGHGAACAVAANTAVARDQAPGDHQTIQGHCLAAADFDYTGAVRPVESHISHAVIVQIAIDGDVLVDQQFRGELHRHAGAEGHNVAVLRRGDGRAQRADPGVGIVGGRPLRQPPVIGCGGLG